MRMLPFDGWMKVLYLFLADHKSQFYIDCNRCVCSAGEVVCTRRQCLRPSATKMEREQHTGEWHQALSPGIISLG